MYDKTNIIYYTIYWKDIDNLLFIYPQHNFYLLSLSFVVKKIKNACQFNSFIIAQSRCKLCKPEFLRNRKLNRFIYISHPSNKNKKKDDKSNHKSTVKPTRRLISNDNIQDHRKHTRNTGTTNERERGIIRKRTAGINGSHLIQIWDIHRICDNENREDNRYINFPTEDREGKKRRRRVAV